MKNIILLFMAFLLVACSPSPEALAKQTADAAAATQAAWTATPADTATPVPTNTPAPTATPAMPTYSAVLKTYPADAELTCTDAEVTDISADGNWTFSAGLICPGKSQLTVAEGKTFTVGETFMNATWKGYGVKITVKNPVKIDGNEYPAGAFLTADKDLNWIQVSSWE